MLVVPATGHAAKGKDSDRDGLSDRFERSFSHTKPQDGDSDADGLGDGREVHRTRTNPRRADTDKDGLSDGREIRIRTDPRDRDTDGDGLTDGSEVNGATVFKRPFFEDRQLRGVESATRRYRPGWPLRPQREAAWNQPRQGRHRRRRLQRLPRGEGGQQPARSQQPREASASAASAASSTAACGHHAPGYRDQRRSVRDHSFDLRRVQLHVLRDVLELLLSPRRSRLRVVRLTEGIHGSGPRNAHVRRPRQRLGREHRCQCRITHVDRQLA